MPETTCRECGKPLPPYKGRGRPRILCEECARISCLRSWNERNQDNYHSNPEYRRARLEASRRHYAARTDNVRPALITQLIERLHMFPAGVPVGSVYIAGPMTGIPDFNRPAFHAAAGHWLERCYEVYNPAMAADDIPLGDIYAADIAALARCDTVYFLPGWEESDGARIEMAVASYLDKERVMGGE